MDFLRLAVVILILLFFAGLAIGHIVKPDYFIKRASVRNGGEMLKDLDRLGSQFFGLALLAGTLYVAYDTFFGPHVSK
jgi:hypothetical protein